MGSAMAAPSASGWQIISSANRFPKRFRRDVEHNASSRTHLAIQSPQRWARISHQQHQCLSIIDANTYRLQGNNWNALIHQEGAVIKSTAAPGGTFSVGKNAPFNLSDLTTAFYSTWFLTKRGKHEQLEGKSVLILHHNPDQKQALQQILQHVGFYRNLDGTPIQGRQIPDYFWLCQSCTGVYIIGFNPGGRDWEAEIILAILRNMGVAYPLPPPRL